MSPNNQTHDGDSNLQQIKTSDSFYKWFLEVQSKISEDSVDLIHEDFVRTLLPLSSLSAKEDDEDEDLPLVQKRRLERVKKYLAVFSDADILLELAEDERMDSKFVWEFSPLETVSVLGAIGFFNCYLKRQNEAAKALEKLVNFTETFEKIQDTKISYLTGIKSVVCELINFYEITFGDSSSLINESSNSKPELEQPDLATNKTSSIEKCDPLPVVLAIKNYFLMGFQLPETFLSDQVGLVNRIIENDPETSEFHLNRYQIKRSIRLQDSLTKFPSEEEKLDAESAFKNSPKNPWNILAVCQFFTDFLAGNGPSGLKLGDLQFKKHTDVVTFIRDSAKEISESFPTFLRANCTFAEIFANELPITRQEKEFAKSLLDKALNANPLSSKINHKMGLCLMKSRQFSEAKRHITKAIELEPSNTTAHYNLVKLLLRDPTGINKELLEKLFNTNFDQITDTLGPENQFAFWKASYFFITGDRDLAVNMWAEIILEFYVNKPELDLATVLPFDELTGTTRKFFWVRSPLTLESVDSAVRSAISKEKTRRRVVLNRLLDLVKDAVKNRCLPSV